MLDFLYFLPLNLKTNKVVKQGLLGTLGEVMAVQAKRLLPLHLVAVVPKSEGHVIAGLLELEHLVVQHYESLGGFGRAIGNQQL